MYVISLFDFLALSICFFLRSVKTSLRISCSFWDNSFLFRSIITSFREASWREIVNVFVNFSFFVALLAEKRTREFGNGTREGRNWTIYLCHRSQRGTYSRFFFNLASLLKLSL